MRIPSSSWSFSLLLNDGTSYSKPLGHDGAFVTFVHQVLSNGYRLQLAFHPDGTKTIKTCHLHVPTSTQPDEWLLGNGFQSWTETHWHRPTDSIPTLRSIAQPLMGYYGDYHMDWIPRQKGLIHSWSWTERRSQDEKIELLASLNEHTAFSCFQWYFAKDQLQIEIDCRAWEVKTPVILADIVVLEGTVDTVYEEWVKLMQLPALRAPIARGWTSWYQHYTNISEDIVRTNITAFQQRGRQLDFFQIDDGYQTAVGDWLSITEKFPNGMAHLAKDIKTQGLQPGLWLAPCVADSRSLLLRNHPEWVQTDLKGKPLKAGYNPLWKGWFYALDTEHPGWQAYMQHVFETVVSAWGFALLKLDFLYAACIYPSREFTRAQLIRRMLERIRSWAGPETYLLGCGTPLAAGFGLFDYCRIGADIHLRWEHQLLRFFRHRERVSTLAALRSVLGRAALAGRVWRNDPDVYLLRDDNMHMNSDERQLVHRLHTLLGELLFTSDNPSTYGEFQTSEEQWQDQHWGPTRCKVTPLNKNHFLVDSGAEKYLVELGKKTGKIKST